MSLIFAPSVAVGCEEQILVRQNLLTAPVLVLAKSHRQPGWAIRHPGPHRDDSLEIAPASAGATLEEVKVLAALYLEHAGDMHAIGTDPRVQRIQAAVQARWNEVPE